MSTAAVQNKKIQCRAPDVDTAAMTCFFAERRSFEPLFRPTPPSAIKCRGPPSNPLHRVTSCTERGGHRTVMALFASTTTRGTCRHVVHTISPWNKYNTYTIMIVFYHHSIQVKQLHYAVLIFAVQLLTPPGHFGSGTDDPYPTIFLCGLP